MLLLLIFDLLANAYEIDILNVNCFTTFNSGTDWDILYSGSSTAGKIYAHQSEANEVLHKKHSDFSGTFSNARYIPTTIGGDSDSPVIEIARTETIDELTGTIDDLTGTIDRGSLTGTYTSHALNVNAKSYDKIYWNENLVSSGDNITVAIKSASTEAGLSAAVYSSEYTNPSGSDISALTANDWMQYRITLTTDDYGHSPTLYKNNNYVIKISYLKEAEESETEIPLHWRSGFTDLGYPINTKSLTKIDSYHNGSTGTLTLKFTMLDYNNTTKKYEEVSDTFDIDLSEYPEHYTNWFTNGALTGKLSRLDITYSNVSPLSIDRIILTFNREPL